MLDFQRNSEIFSTKFFRYTIISEHNWNKSDVIRVLRWSTFGEMRTAETILWLWLPFSSREDSYPGLMLALIHRKDIETNA